MGQGRRGSCSGGEKARLGEECRLLRFEVEVEGRARARASSIQDGQVPDRLVEVQAISLGDAAREHKTCSMFIPRACVRRSVCMYVCM